MMKMKTISIFVCMLLITSGIVFFENSEVKADPGGGEDNHQIGYELIDNNTVLHIWNNHNSYYFNTSSGIQLTNHYDKYWSHNVLMLGYYNNNEWNLIYRTDELSGFNKNIETDNETFVNATLWKDLTYGGYNFRLAIRYHLGIDDSELTIIPYIKNLGQAIPYVLGFAWEINDIQIDMTPENDYIEINDTSFYLNETIDVTYTNLSDTRFHIKENMGNNSYKDLYLKWNKLIPYNIMINSREGQYNAPVTLAIRVGTLAENQEKQVELFWHDSFRLEILEITLYSIKDSYLRKNYPNNNYGSLNYMWINPKLTQTNRMLVQMDLPSELDDTYIESATLKIRYYAYSGINPQYRKHECWRIEESWDENEVTWNNQPDLDGLEDTITLGGAYEYKSWDVTDNVQDFVNGDLDNYGWLLGDETEGTALSRAAKYYSREQSGTIYDPKLVIEYLAPPEAPQISGLKDQRQESQTTYFYVNACHRMAQSFKPAYPELICVSIYACRCPQAIETNYLWLYIRSSLTGSDLASKSILVGDLPLSFDWILFDFSDISVNVEETYFIVVKHMHICGDACIKWGADTGNPYGRGEAWSWTGVDGPWVEETGYDTTFRTYTNEPSGTELWFYPPYYDDDTHIQNQEEFYVNSQILKNLMMPLGLNFTNQINPEEPIPLGFPYAEADADKDTGEVYVRSECYTNPIGNQSALAEAIIIGPEEQTFKVSENGNYIVTFYTSLTDGIVWIYCDSNNINGKAAGAAVIEGLLYEEGNEDPINYNGEIIYHHIDLGFNEYHVNFDPETYEFSFNQFLTADTEYYFKFFLSMFSHTKSVTGEAKAWGQLEMCLDSVSVIKQ